MRLFASYFLCVAAACSAAHEEPRESIPIPAEVSVEEFFEHLAVIECERERECQGLFGLPVLRGEDCAGDWLESYETRALPAWRIAIGSGGAHYDPRSAAQCLIVVRDGSCMDLAQLEGLPPCQRAMEGQSEIGTSCLNGLECAGRAACVFDDRCPGTCEPRPGPGEECRRNSECPHGFHCLAAADARSQCEQWLEPGSECLHAIDSCAPGFTCSGGLRAAGFSFDAETEGVCEPLALAPTAGVGEACDFVSTGCRGGLSCGVVSAADHWEWGCLAPAESGGACNRAIPDVCPAGEYCELASVDAFRGRCRALPGVGEPCADDVGAIRAWRCAPGSTCSQSSRRCIELGEVGARCEWWLDCATGYCDADGTCAPIPFCTTR